MTRGVVTSHRLRIGVQSWTLQALSFDLALRATAAAGLSLMQLSPAHISPREPYASLRDKQELMAGHGVVAHSFGVAETSTSRAANEPLFEFARELKLEALVVEPEDPRILDVLERLAVEYSVDVVVHNHGPGTQYAEPALVRELLAGRDRRMGACLDSGWVTAAGYDAAEVFRDYEGRVLDIHLKDIVVSGSRVEHVALGRGAVNLMGVIAAAEKYGFRGLLAIESDADTEDPAALLASSADIARSFATAKS